MRTSKYFGTGKIQVFHDIFVLFSMQFGFVYLKAKAKFAHNGLKQFESNSIAH